MDYDKAFNIAVGCILASGLTAQEKNDVIDTLREMESSRECEWAADDYGLWKCSKCDIAWTFNDDGPEENDTNYCPKCGRKIIESIYYYEEDEL